MKSERCSSIASPISSAVCGRDGYSVSFSMIRDEFFVSGQRYVRERGADFPQWSSHIPGCSYMYFPSLSHMFIYRTLRSISYDVGDICQLAEFNFSFIYPNVKSEGTGRRYHTQHDARYDLALRSLCFYGRSYEYDRCRVG